MRRCIFCGKTFTGQATNFEHVIPQWLVEEADLSKRSAPVNFLGRKFDVGLNRLGTKVCEKCNDERSGLEAAAKGVYLKIRDGIALTQNDGKVLLDWLDKIRIGLWLWANTAAPPEEKLEPKFYINQRLGNADRIAVISRYDNIGRGIMFEGLDFWFRSAPSAFGFVANNLAFFSYSSEFLLARHLKKLSIKCTLLDNDHQKAEVDLSDSSGDQLYFLGSNFIIGQCVLDVSLFEDLKIEMHSVNAYNKLGESKVMRLTPALREDTPSLGIVPLNPIKPNFILQKLNTAKVSRFLCKNYLRTDFSQLSDPKHKRTAQETASFFESFKAAEIQSLAAEYQATTGIRLLGL